MVFSRYNGFPLRVLTMVEDDRARSRRSFELIGRGLYHHHTGATFAGEVAAVVEFMRLSEDEPWAQGQAARAIQGNRELEWLIRRTDEHFNGLPDHGANPEVFSYQIAYGSEGIDGMRLRFYGNSYVSLTFRGPGGWPAAA